MKKNSSYKTNRLLRTRRSLILMIFSQMPHPTQDCTGLIPSGPINEDELESYEAAISLSATQNQRYLPK